MAILADLALRLRANSAELTTGLNKAKSSLKDAGKASSEFGNIAKDAFDKATSAIDNIIPGFSSFTSGVGKAIKSVTSLSGSLKILKVALISTGIGAIVVALGSLVALFTKADRGADAFSEKLAGVKAVLGVVVQRLALFAEGLIAFIKLDFKGGVEKMKEAFSDLGDEIENAFNQGENLKRSLNDLADVEAGMILTEAELGNKIKLAREVVNDEAASFAEKQKAINVAADAELELYQKQKAVLWEKYRIEKEQNDILRRNGEDNEDMLARENTILAEIENINGERAMAMSRIGKMQERITKDAASEAKARADALKALKEENQALTLKIDTALPKTEKLDTTKLVSMTPQTIPAPNFTLAENAWLDYKEGINTIWKTIEWQALDSFNKIKDSVVNVGDMISGALVSAVTGLTEAFGNLFAGTETGFKDVVTGALQAIQQIINALLAQAIAGMIAGESKKGLVGLVTASIGIGALLALWKNKVPEFANGGLAYGPTLGLVGEYAGARSNPEVIAPLNDLRNILGTTGMSGEVRFVIEQDKLVGVLSDYNKKQMYF